MSNDRIRTLRIKTGVVKRLAKEKITYKTEAIQQQAKIEEYKQQGKDVHLIRKQEEVLQESLMMIPDCQRRLLKAFEDLKKMIDAEENFDDTEAFFEAKNVLKEAEIQINKDAYEFEIKNQLEALNSTLELCFPTISKKKKDALTFSELLFNNKNCFQTEKKNFFVSNKNDVIYLCSKNHQLKDISSKLNNISMYREWKKQKVVVENLRHDINVLFNISRQNKVKHQINNLKCQRNIMKTKINRSFHACLLMKSYNNNKKVSSTIKIDHWLKKKENEINTEKAAEVIRKNADMILFDVRTKRTGTKKFLSLLHELRNLRKIKRTHMELQENITTDRAEKVFNSIVDSLMIQWITLDKEYFMEETGLKLMIESNKRKQLHENEKKKSCKWLSLLFQNCSFCKCQVKNLKIIFLRIIWDNFFNSGQGLKIPIGWIIPSQPYITAWTKCTVKNKVFT